MRFFKIIILLMLLALTYTSYDFITLTDRWRFFDWEMFFNNERKILSREFKIGPPQGSAKSGEGIFPDSPYVFTEGWFLSHYSDWENHLKALKGKPGIHALEIGSYEGLSAIWQLENILTDPGSTITCIDIFDYKEIEDRFDRNIEASGISSKVIKLKGSSEKMLRGLDVEKFDYVYIDGSHTPKWVLSDAVLSWDLLKKDGLMIFDDYLKIPPKPKRFRPTTISFVDNYLWKKRARDKDSPEPVIDSFLKIYDPYLEVVFKKLQVVLKKK